jgi:hypothetical protein
MQNETGLSTLRLARLCAVALAAGALLAPAAARAFTMEGGGAQWAPKFDLEEQAKEFRQPGRDAKPGTAGVDTPIGKLQFGVQQGASPFSTPFGFDARPSHAGRQHYDRMFDPSYQFNAR